MFCVHAVCCRVHPSFAVGTVWRGIRASCGGGCLPAFGETQGRRRAWPYGGVRRFGGHRAGTRPAPTGVIVGMTGTIGVAGVGRHEAFPYRSVWGNYCWLDILVGKNDHGR